MRRGKEAKENRRKSALKCQQSRSKITNKEQLEKLDNQGYRAVRERARLNKNTRKIA